MDGLGLLFADLKIPLPLISIESSEISRNVAFYTPNHPTVYRAQLGEKRMNQYDFWHNWSTLKQKSKLMIIRTGIGS